MKVLLAALVLVLATGCGSAKPVHVAADLPPSPATWKPYPARLPSSCWGRPVGTGLMRAAPTVLGQPTRKRPTQIVRAALARFGDRRFVQGAEIGVPPPVATRHANGYFGGSPPSRARWLYVSVAGTRDLATWEASLFGDGLRDEFCTAGGAPLVGFTTGHGELHVFDRIDAVAQHFPSPSPAEFRARVIAIGKRFGFQIASLRLLHAPQIAPLLVVRADGARKAFITDVPKIMSLLDPRNGEAQTFEGFFFRARDKSGPFVDVFDVHRGEVFGGQWTANPCNLPYPTGGSTFRSCRS